jgi:DnaJ-class molecular chaperone
VSDDQDTPRETIMRRVEHYEEVEIPEGQRRCPTCKGKGSMSKYDLGWNSLSHEPSLDAQATCWQCEGAGFVPDLPHSV